jgi:two-component system chemotaxis response regulator CheB
MSAPNGSWAVAVGASAGGVEALTRLFRALPDKLPAPFFVVLHVSPAGTSVLPAILARATAAPVVSALDGMAVRPGTVYVAPPDRHLIVEGGRVRLTRAPRENGHRPSIDVTFRTVSECFGRAAVGVVLSGTRDDGSAGLRTIKDGGGPTFVQDPQDALYTDMPQNAIEQADPDAVLPLAALASRLAELLSTPAPSEEPIPDPVSSDLTLSSGPEAGNSSGAAVATRFTCPDCGGVMFESRENGVERFRCSIGHVYSVDSLNEEHERALESAMWEAVRLLEERAVMLRRLGARMRESAQERLAGELEQRAADLLERSRTIRQVVERPGPAAEVMAEDG